jgi:hypothetical protein
MRHIPEKNIILTMIQVNTPLDEELIALAEDFGISEQDTLFCLHDLMSEQHIHQDMEGKYYFIPHI